MIEHVRLYVESLLQLSLMLSAFLKLSLTAREVVDRVSNSNSLFNHEKFERKESLS